MSEPSEAKKLVPRLREGGCDPYCDQLEWDAADEIERLRAEVERLLAAVAAERERCAKLCQAQAIDCDSWDEGAGGDGGRVAANMCAAAIRGA